MNDKTRIELLLCKIKFRRQEWSRAQASWMYGMRRKVAVNPYLQCWKSFTSSCKYRSFRHRFLTRGFCRNVRRKFVGGWMAITRWRLMNENKVAKHRRYRMHVMKWATFQDCRISTCHIKHTRRKAINMLSRLESNIMSHTLRRWMFCHFRNSLGRLRALRARNDQLESVATSSHLRKFKLSSFLSWLSWHRRSMFIKRSILRILRSAYLRLMSRATSQWRCQTGSDKGKASRVRQTSVQVSLEDSVHANITVPDDVPHITDAVRVSYESSHPPRPLSSPLPSSLLLSLFLISPHSSRVFSLFLPPPPPLLLPSSFPALL